MFSTFAQTILDQKYAHTKEDGTKETWEEVADRVATHVVKPYFPEYVEPIKKLIVDRKLMPGGRYLYATGRPYHQVNNCALFSVEDSREGWADLMKRITNTLMTGAGIGVVYSKLRESGSFIKGLGGTSTGPLALMQMVNECGRHIMQGNSRRSALWAGLHWWHPDVFTFIESKNWSDDIKALKEKDYNFPAPLDGTNISVILDDDFFVAYYDENHPKHQWAYDVYWKTIKQMCTTSEPGFSINTGANVNEVLRNACTEVSSEDDNDVCNLASLNLAQFTDIFEFQRAVEYATIFLLCGTLYSMLPSEEIAKVREKNRRLGLGLMGIHEWLLVRGYRYESNDELKKWLEVYATSTKIAHRYADRLGISRPVKTRALAPTGTIAIIAETTSSIEPIFCVAFKRRYLKGKTWHAQYVIDAAAKRLLDRGVKADDIEDAYMLARDVERRVAFQEFVQRYVDHGISSTINLPAWGTEYNNEETMIKFGEMLLKYLPNLRGVTTYADGSRGGQPLTPVSLEEALYWEGTEFEEHGNENACRGGVCGI